MELDYALVRHSTYKFGREDVNVTLVVSYDKKNLRSDLLRLNYFILICMKEINPTSYNNESQSGIFRTVTTERKREESIQSEEVNWVGYYSMHEQSMESMMHLQVKITFFQLLFYSFNAKNDYVTFKISQIQKNISWES